jgi:hypothetical protein
MRVAQDDFWREVVGRSAQGVGAALPDMLREPEVRDAQVTLVVNEHVLRLEVTVHDIEAVHVFEGEDHTAREELRLIVVEGAATPEQREQLAPQYGLLKEVEAVGVLECSVQAHQKGMHELHHDRFFAANVLLHQSARQDNDHQSTSQDMMFIQY